MNRFTAKYADRLAGVLSGFDRLVFRGTMRRLSYVEGLKDYLWQRKVLLKDFGAHAQTMTERVKGACLAAAKEAGIPVQYLPSRRPARKRSPARSHRSEGSCKDRCAG